MNYILIIKGISSLEYQSIKDDLTKQYQAKGMEVPAFCRLPQEAEVEVLWIENYKLSLESMSHNVKMMSMLND